MVCSMIIHNFILPHASHTVIVRTSVFMDSSVAAVADKASLSVPGQPASLVPAKRKKTVTLLK